MRSTSLLGLLALACASQAPMDQLPVWAINSTPLVTIGASESDPGHELAGVTGALRVAGKFIVANSGSHEIRQYDSAGRYLGASGRKGQGPGDFVAVISVFPAPGDSLHVLDVENLRWTVHDASGRYARVLSGGAEALPRPVRLYRRTIVESPAPGPIPQWVIAALNGLRDMAPTAPIRRARLDDLGFLWISDSIASGVWTVLADSAAAVGQVMLPKGFELMEAGSDILLGLERDTLDQEIVRAYSLDRPRQPAPPAREPIATIRWADSPNSQIMITDFRNLLMAQEMFYSQHGSYTARSDSLDYRPASGTELTILHGSPHRWAAVLYDRKSGITCAISVGFPAPAGWIDGSPFCGQ